MMRVHPNLPVQGKHSTCPNLSGYEDPKIAHICRDTRVSLDENLHIIDTYGFRRIKFQRLGEMPRLI